MRGKLKLPSLEEALTILSNGFVRGASGFLKAGGPELLKGGGATRETRVGVTQVGMALVGLADQYLGFVSRISQVCFQIELRMDLASFPGQAGWAWE